MIRGVVLVVVLVIGVIINEGKCEPSTLQATLNNQYYLGSGVGQSNVKNYNAIEHTLSEEENKIVQDVYSPDYYEPNIILDYRYLKTGGRGYARSDGGQILILPKRNQMPNLYNNYDTLIEYLRLKHQNQINQYWKMDPQETSKGEDAIYKSFADKGWAAYIR
ncbi:uncharacterized protein LOC113393332 [Vanessa tameamea]|uniref:Uncharacterized protein LOC113393332 n=1 Tax=Vanessa tameamea TaxID=334116 RepID=A0A8B8HMN0_VANTA|nr:uncharacterized protein LOC113393332 [Vanessa tameamea]